MQGPIFCGNGVILFANFAQVFMILCLRGIYFHIGDSNLRSDSKFFLKTKKKGKPVMPYRKTCLQICLQKTSTRREAHYIPCSNRLKMSLWTGKK